jgi:hypothetical protein
MKLPYKQGPVTLGDRFLLGFGGALAGFFTGLLLFLMVNWALFALLGGAPGLKWHYLAFHWVWWITAVCAVFAFVATEAFVQVISAVWDAMGELIRLWGRY